ncbi:hypothetical protein AB0C69_28850 [Actinomadura sp. NPDC048032]
MEDKEIPCMSGLFDRLSLNRLTPEDKAVGVAVGAVLAARWARSR